MSFPIRIAATFAAFLLVLAGCGGGSSNQTPSGTGEGGLTLLLGDGPLDNVESVLLDLEEVILLGSGGQRQVLFQDDLREPIDLLRLRNLTERIFDGDIPAGDYNKIRMIISSIEIVEQEGGPRELAQLPARGKIDVNPQGPFEIVAGEDLVIEIDFELDRAVHVVLTGNSKYKFRPVVFVDVIDQAANARLTHIFGEVARPGAGEVPFVICEALAGGGEECSDIVPTGDTRFFDQDGEPLSDGEPMDMDMAHAFGHYYVEGEAEPGADNVVRFRPVVVIKGAEDAIRSIEGDVIAPAAGLIPLDTIDDETDASDTNVTTTEGTLVLNKIGMPMVPATGQEAEAWGLTSRIALAEPDFPAFLVLLSEDDAEETAEGLLMSVDGDIIILDDEEGGEVCVTYQGAEDTKIFQINEGVDESEGTPIGMADLRDLVGTVPTPEVSVFGEIVDGCVVADSIIVEIED